MSDLMMTHFAPVRPSANRSALGHLTLALKTSWRTYVTRRSLPDLTPRELADIGLDRGDALAEAARLPWETAPSSRRRHEGVLGRLQRLLHRARIRRLVARLEARQLSEF